jgi:hypothetical protein
MEEAGGTRSQEARVADPQHCLQAAADTLHPRDSAPLRPSHLVPAFECFNPSLRDSTIHPSFSALHSGSLHRSDRPSFSIRVS